MYTTLLIVAVAVLYSSSTLDQGINTLLTLVGRQVEPKTENDDGADANYSMWVVGQLTMCHFSLWVDHCKYRNIHGMCK